MIGKTLLQQLSVLGYAVLGHKERGSVRVVVNSDIASGVLTNEVGEPLGPMFDFPVAAAVVLAGVILRVCLEVDSESAQKALAILPGKKGVGLDITIAVSKEQPTVLEEEQQAKPSITIPDFGKEKN